MLERNRPPAPRRPHPALHLHSHIRGPPANLRGPEAHRDEPIGEVQCATDFAHLFDDDNGVDILLSSI